MIPPSPSSSLPSLLPGFAHYVPTPTGFLQSVESLHSNRASTSLLDQPCLQEEAHQLLHEPPPDIVAELSPRLERASRVDTRLLSNSSAVQRERRSPSTLRRALETSGALPPAEFRSIPPPSSLTDRPAVPVSSRVPRKRPLTPIQSAPRKRALVRDSVLQSTNSHRAPLRERNILYVQETDPIERYTGWIDELVHEGVIHPHEEGERMSRLILETARLSAEGLLPGVDEQRIIHLITLLGESVARCRIGIDSEVEEDAISSILGGFDGIRLLLEIMTARHISKRVMQEEALEGLIHFVKYFLVRHVFPAYDASFHAVEPGDRKDRPPLRSVTIRPLLVRLTDLLHRMSLLVEVQNLEDIHLIQLTNMALGTLFCEGIKDVQLSALRIIRTVFWRFKRHQDVILQDIVANLMKLPKAKRNYRPFKLQSSEKSVQMVTALVLQLIHSCVLQPHPLHTIDTEAAANELPLAFVESSRVVQTFVKSILARCATKPTDKDSDYRDFFASFLEDLLAMLNLPEWPAAELVLFTLAGSVAGSLKTGDTALRAFGLDTLGQICGRIRSDVLFIDQRGPPGDEGQFPLETALLTFLAKKAVAVGDGSIECARKFLLCKWSNDFRDDKELQRFCCEKFNEKPGILSEDEWPTRFVMESTIRLASRDSLTNLLGKFSQLLAEILRASTDEQTCIRAKALRALGMIIEKDPRVLGEDAVYRALVPRFTDRHISVRQAAVDIVGAHVMDRDEFTDMYYKKICDRVTDKGVSVRKTAINALRRIHERDRTHVRAREICSKLLGRTMDDEESVKSLAIKSFHEMWFTPVQHESAEDVAAQILMTLEFKNEGGPSNAELFYHLLRESARPSREGLEKTCSRLCDCVKERILQEGDQGGVVGPVAFRVLEIVSFIFPTLLVPHVTTLAPFLTPDEGDTPVLVQSIVPSVANILQVALPLMTHPSYEFVKTVGRDLASQIFRSDSSEVVSRCTQALCRITERVTKDFGMLFQILCRFFDSLKESQGPRFQKPHVLRALYGLGVLCRFFDFDDAALSGSVWSHSVLKPGSVMDALLSLFETFTEKHWGTHIRQIAVIGMGFLFIRKPEAMARDSLVAHIKACLVDDDTKLQVLNHNFAEFLTDLENRQHTAADGHGNGSKTTAFLHGDTGWSPGGFVNIFLSDILSCLHDRSTNVRKAALKVVGLVLRQGLVFSSQVVPHLMSLDVDEDSDVRDQAFRLVRFLYEKEPSCVSSFISRGVVLALEYQNQHKERTGGSAMFSRVYELVRDHVKDRNAFLLALIRRFENVQGVEPEELEYFAAIGATLPFCKQEEPMQIIQEIDRYVSVHATAVVDALKTFFERGETGKQNDEELQHLSKPAASLCLLLSLKRYYRNRFGILNDSKGALRILNRSPFVAWHPCGEESLSRARAEFKELRRLLKEDAMDTTFVDVTPIKRGTPRRRVSRWMSSTNSHTDPATTDMPDPSTKKKTREEG